MVRVSIAALFVGFAGWYSPFITAAAWHLFHPTGRVNYRGLNIRVPWPWTADVDAVKSDSFVSPQGISLKKMPYTMDRRLAVQAIFVTVISQDPGKSVEQQTASWMEAFRATHPGSNFVGETPVSVPLGVNCLGAKSPFHEKDLVWTCISVADGWVADFEGQGVDEPTFFEVVTHLRGEK
ncbi:hypothetical protein ACPOL_1231 [Acidisarcina polymorpha]|uniref:Uncharacterized protein n=1 Tax=Acidisarcina polymorpha TaxID=2211140 RepID=A0A2Z5FUM5_9BACT|nr:hypothetical protein [Acidisarcina polymorpha]AXC10579.1 hypothetical protein ACPOL_1231 [Acidisarcina polymorpha]